MIVRISYNLINQLKLKIIDTGGFGFKYLGKREREIER